MLGYRFSKFVPNPQGQSTFDKLLKLLNELLVYTSGDVQEAISWLNELDREYKLAGKDYGIGDFIEDLKKQGYLKENGDGAIVITAKTEQGIRRSALEEVFGKLRKARKGSHHTPYTGMGDEQGSDRRPYAFGDSLDQISVTDSIRNAQIAHGIGSFALTEDDLEIIEKENKSQVSTVMMIDISHSMILYGEDRITPAKKVAMALAELITTRYAKDTLDIIAFGDDAWQIEIKDLPYLKVGPYHTNTVAGLELAMDILRRRKNPNRQIFMVTDGKPTCMKEGGRYYKNSFGLDRKIINKTLTLAKSCRRLKMPITTFMLARDPYLQRFVKEFTQTNNGRAFYTSLQGLGEYIFEDYEKNKRKWV